MSHPADWETVTVGDVAEYINGMGFKKTDWGEEGVPIIRIQNLTRPDAPFNRTTREIPEKNLARDGDILVSWSATLDAFLWRGEDAAVNQHIFKVVPDNRKVDSRFLYHQLRHVIWEMTHGPHLHGSTMQHINRRPFLGHRFLLPNLETQRRLVDALEDQLHRLAGTAADLTRAKSNIARARASILGAAVEGRLVPTEADLAKEQRREFEHASEVVGHTAAPSRPSRFGSRSSDIVPGHAGLSIGDTEAPLPNGWTRSPLVDIARMESGHTPSRRHPEWWGGEVPWISIPDARDHHGGEIADTLNHTNQDGLANSAARMLPAGTVCLSRTASVGYVVRMGRPMATSQDFANWVCTEALDPRWLQAIFMADRGALRRFGKGSVHKTIYYPDLMAFHVAVPPPVEQRRIVDEIDRRFSVLDKLEEAVDLNLLRCERLRQAILKWAFEGKFVNLEDPAPTPTELQLAEAIT